jgi:hypothetical protein
MIGDQCSGSGSGIRCLLTPDPISGIGFSGSRIPDPGSRIPDPGSLTHIFVNLMTNFRVKSNIILSVLALKTSLPVQK